MGRPQASQRVSCSLKLTVVYNPTTSAELTWVREWACAAANWQADAGVAQILQALQ